MQLQCFAYRCHHVSDTFLVFCYAASGLPTSCRAVKEASPSATSGAHWLNIGGTAVRGYCDMDTDGGGWLLVLNYVHKGGTNPEPYARTLSDGFPLLNSTTLGDDESGSWVAGGSWGHMAPNAFTQVCGCLMPGVMVAC